MNISGILGNIAQVFTSDRGLLLSLLVILAMPEEKKRELPLDGLAAAFPARARGKRLYYLDKNLKSVPKSQKKAQKVYYIWARNVEEARALVRSGQGEFAGDTANCVAPYEVETERGSVIRCAMYAPACSGQKGCRANALPKGPRLRHCVEYKKVSCGGYSCDRCAKMESLCTKESCFEGKIPLPEKILPSRKEVEDYAKSMYYEEKEMNREAGPWLYREIMERGGLKAYKGAQKEEWKGIPLHLKRKTGKTLDEMASEMGLDESQLVQLINQTYSELSKEGRKKKAWKDYINKAYSLILRERQGFSGIGDLWTDYSKGPKQQDLFKAKRELVMEPEDISKSDDPLTICLERRGWNPKQVEKLQASIAEKMTIDLFSGKTKKLTGSEVQLQENIQDCLSRLQKSKGRVSRP